ncbi:flagellar filament capping protein FliD [Sanguibacter antarcticus]|uniref:Flagellar hook-associated protein 2 n=1 Tax=Sanguibacter antarcticus TaxID=372484 RepID=A0A2A9E1I1_9MICO|nr:flagellar filament capping protein FliD [Sanguibacter antarcticus]PFG32225.1 flagellar hook-associated protein 2 [Sanguibacter antarcticus]
MASFGIDGLVSGLDTTSLITQLMAVEAAPQTLLKAKVSTTQTFISTLQGLNTRVSSLADAATTATKTASWSAVKASTTGTSATATASSTAQASSLTFTVDKLAKAQTSVTGNVTSLADLFGGTVPSSVTIAKGSADATATATVVDLTGVTDLAGFAAKLNSAGVGISASVVKISATESRLQLTGSGSGDEAAFELHSGTVAEADIQAGTAPAALIKRSDAIIAASDAQITLWGSQPVKSATNTFSDVLTGVDITVSAVDATSTTVTVARDDTALTKLASDLVGALGVVLSEIKSRTATTTTTASDGGSVITAGILGGDSATRSLNQAIITAASYPVDGTSPSEVGIILSRDGTFSFDETVFAAAMAADPAKVQKIISGLAERVEGVATSASDSIDGTLTLKITNQQSFSKDLSTQVDDWDRRLATRKEGLQATYAALEVSLSALNAQSSWLTSSLASLSTWS